VKDGNIALLDAKDNANELGAFTGLKAGAEKVEFVINDDMLAKINAAEALYIRYQYLTITKVDLIEKPVPQAIADGKYYIQNVATKKYLAGGASWGTHAVVNLDGLDYGVAFADGKYTLNSQVSNGGKNYYLNGEWNDGAAMGWAIEEVADGKFTISDGSKYLTAASEADADGFFLVTLTDAKDEAAQWQFRTLEDRLADLTAATAEAPVDATFLIQDANFGRNDLRKSAWTMQASNQNLSGGNNINNCAESYHAVFTLSQTLANAPAGKYQMTAQGFYRQDDNETEDLPVFYANDKTAEFPAKTSDEGSMAAASASFTAGQYTIEPIEVTVAAAGGLTVGAKGTATHQWVIFDNFRLTYLGNQIDLSELVAAYQTALDAATQALNNEANAIITGEERTALTTTIRENSTVDETSQEALTAAIAALNEATNAFNAAKAAYQELIDAKAMADLNAFKYASAEKKAAVEAAQTAEPTNAADATAKAAALLKAYRQYAESSALLEGVEGATNYTDSIVNPTAEEAIAEPWSVVLGEGSGGSLDVKSNEPWTDGADNATHKYFDGGNWGANAWDVALQQTINLPKGKYQLTVKARSSMELSSFNVFAGEAKTEMIKIGAAGGLFNRGWNDNSVEFEMAEDGAITIGVQGVTSTVHNWMSFSDFRLVQFPAEVEEDVLVVVPETATIEEDWTIDGIFRTSQQANNVTKGTKVAFDGNTIYVQGISYYFPDAWLKGTITDAKAVFATGQFVGEDEYGKEYMLGSADGQNISDIEFEWNAETKVLTLSTYVLENGDVKDKFNFYGYYTPGLTISKGEYVKPEPVVVPDGLVTEEYSLVAKNAEGEAVSTAMKVGFNGNDVYFQGFSTFIPEAWVKGTLSEDGKTVTVAASQYLGAYSSYEMYFNFKGYDIELAYDAEAGKFTASNVIQINNGTYYFDYYVDAVITKVVEKAATPANPSITGIVKDSYDYDVLTFTVPTVDTEGNGLLTSKLSFQLYSDIEGTVAPITFKKSEYSKLTEDMTVIPYGFTDDYDFATEYIYLNMDFSAWNKVGIKSIYTGGGETNETEIQWYTIKESTGIANIIADDANARYFDLQGRAAQKNAKGMLIKQIRQADGTVRNIKVMK